MEESIAKIPTEKNTSLILLHNSKAITDLHFNRDGDLLFSASKTPEVSLCNLEGEVINFYNGVDGAVTSLAVSKDSKLLGASSADQSYVVFDVETNKIIKNDVVSSIPRHLFFSFLKNELVITCDDSYNHPPLIFIPDLRSKEISFKFTPSYSPTASLLQLSDDKLVFSDVTGGIYVVDRRNEQIIVHEKIHSTKINKMRPSFCNTFFITASNDTYSKILDYELNVLRTFSYDEPLNDACIFGSNDKTACAGGISARDAALSGMKKTFEISFYDIVTEKMIGSYSPHFGTVNAVDIHPSSSMFCSGGEDGRICLMNFRDDFYDAPFISLYE